MAVVFYQRGRLAFHGSSVRFIDGSAAIFCGNSGMGKSSLAAALNAIGHGLLADDVSVIDMGGTSPVIIPAFPMLKLHPKVAEDVKINISNRIDLPAKADKYCYHVLPNFDFEPCPVKHLFFLDRGIENKIIPMSAREAFLAMQCHTAPSMWTSLCDKIHFDLCKRLLSKVSFSIYERKWDVTGLMDQARMIEEHLSNNA